MSACDILVAGGGSAGVAAAVAAARAGARTILLERGRALGGMGQAAFVHTLCGLYKLDTGPPEYANPGFASEFAEALIAAGAARGPVRMGRLDVLPHDPEGFGEVAARLCAGEPGLEVRLGREIVAARAEGGEVAAVEARGGGGCEEIVARAFVDATGDGGLVFLAGGAFAQETAGKLQRPAYIARLGGIASGLLGEGGRLALAHALARGVIAGDLPQGAAGAAFRAGVREGSAFLTIDLEAGGGAWDPVSPESRRLAEEEGRGLVGEIVRYLASAAEGWAEARVDALPERLGVRESRRLVGVHELTGEEIARGERFGDGVAEVAWPMEFRERATGPRWRHAVGEAAARVPLRALRHRDFSNLWMAGRCLSASHEALAAARVMGTCLATGEVAGFAAALGLGGAAEADWGWNGWADRVTAMRDSIRRT